MLPRMRWKSTDTYKVINYVKNISINSAAQKPHLTLTTG